jgi:hypothetical protein
MPFVRRLACAALLVASAVASAGDKKTPAPDEAKEEALFNDIPKGETFRGVRVPQLDVYGNLLMLFDTKTATRVDDQHIEMEDLKIEIHNEDNTTFHVEMPHAIFDLDTRILKSDTPVTIRREDFTITGDSADFHTRTRFGRIIGNVKMEIFNTDQIE